MVPYDLENANRNLALAKVPFLKEPELSQRHVFRSLLRFGKDTNNAIALIWDQPKRKLYLDLNRNLDLTDDPAGVFSSTNKGFQQLFTNVTLPLKTPTGPLPRTAGLAAVQRRARETGPKCSCTRIRLWQAKVALAGEEWQVAAVDNLLGAEGPGRARSSCSCARGRHGRTSYRLYYLTSGIVPFPDQLFWLGQAFHLERRFDDQRRNSPSASWNSRPSNHR